LNTVLPRDDRVNARAQNVDASPVGFATPALWGNAV
jgi:hypothetical protein